ncbi:MAG: zinc ribbon domain-containing protein [Casimicrobiaceae bacterium]
MSAHTGAPASGVSDEGAPGEVLAEEKKYHCPACGAEAQWNPKKQALICPFCGVESPAKIDPSGAIAEHDLVAALRGIPDSGRGWQADKVAVKCQSCQAISVFDPNKQAQRCQFCGSAQLVPYEQTKDAFRPESVLPFKISEGQARDTIRSWYGKVWFAPNALKSRALTDTVAGVYLPYWTFDAQVAARWTAEAGHYYYTTENYEDNNGRTQTRQVQHVRWEPAAGSLDHFFDDELVCASVGVKPALLRGIEPFPTTNQLVPYSSAYVTGWTVERYQIDLVAAAQNSRNQMEGELRALCAAEVPGDTQRNLQVESRWSKQTFKHVLVPVWLLTYHYGAKAFQVVLNGCTGRINGEYPKSWIKITLAVIAVLIVGIIVLSSGRR